MTNRVELGQIGTKVIQAQEGVSKARRSLVQTLVEDEGGLGDRMAEVESEIAEVEARLRDLRSRRQGFEDELRQAGGDRVEQAMATLRGVERERRSLVQAAVLGGYSVNEIHELTHMPKPTIYAMRHKLGVRVR